MFDRSTTVDICRRPVFGLVLAALSFILLPLVGITLPLALAGLFVTFLTFEFTVVTGISLFTEVLPGARATMMSSNIAAMSLGRVIGALDTALFGVHLDEVWLPAMPWVWFSEIMHLAYFGYYLTVILPLLYMLFKGSREMKHDMTLRIVLVSKRMWEVATPSHSWRPSWISATVRASSVALTLSRTQSTTRMGSALIAGSTVEAIV